MKLCSNKEDIFSMNAVNWAKGSLNNTKNTKNTINGVLSALIRHSPTQKV